ncbi:MAG: penicillin acylase family protein [Saprospiraceae bacterium]|nr:penicillin acylase family protein [Saprospiraceae bacterium]
MQKFVYGLHFSIFLFVLFFLNGNIELFRKTIPPFGKFLDPAKGVWHHNVPIGYVEDNLTLPISKQASVIYDERWVPHIMAENLEDILFLQGYTEAENRLFQMELMSRAAAGELSSIFGEVTIELDLDKRRRGIKFAAENAVNAWKQMPEFDLAQKYIDGVNAYISQLKPEDYSLEFKLFNIQPEPWTELKSALIFKEMSLFLCGKNEDIEYTNAKNTFTQDIFNQWYPEHEDIENPVVPDHSLVIPDTLFGKQQDNSSFYDGIIKKTFFETRNPGIGSNQWTVGKSKTKSGSNIFCNDPHLSLGLPSIWFEQHLKTPQFNAYGVSFPGFPGIMIGFNDFIAWGETNVGQDVEDLFLIEWADDKKNTYYLDGKKLKAEIRIEKIAIKGADPLYDTIRYTKWGPIFKSSKDGKNDLSIRWLSHDKPKGAEFMTFVNGMMCKNYDEYLTATEKFQTPAQNFGFSSASGDIAIRINGMLPAKYDQDGRFVEYGNNSKNDWSAFIPRQQNPHVVNPPENYVSSANQRSASKNYPYYFTGNFENYRNKTIIEKLKTGSDFTAQDMQKMQMSSFSPKAKEFVSVIPTDCRQMGSASGINWYDKLKEWSFEYLKDKTEPVFFEIYMKHLRMNTFDEIYSKLDEVAIPIPKDWVLYKNILNDPLNEIFNIKKTSTIENADNIQKLAFFKSIREIDSLMTAWKNLNWGNYNPLHIYHPTRIPALSANNLAADGCPDAINAKGNSFGPSWRMIVHQKNPVEAYGVYPGGQSGNPFSPYYKNMVNDWVEGKYHVLHQNITMEELSKKQVKKVVASPNKVKS